MPRVSIGLPVYNGERFVGEAIGSLLAQSFEDFEILVADNASTDRTLDICRDLAARDARVRVHTSERNLGAAPNFNRAFDLARGEYFKWAAHDDLCEPDYLRSCVEALDDDPSVVLCHSDVHWIDDDSRFLQAYDPQLPDTGSPRPSARFRDLVLSEHFCFDVFGLIRREVLARTPRIASFSGSDRTLLAELGLRGRFHRIPRPLFLSRDHARRSIRSMHPWERAAWFDPALAGRIQLPHWRLLGEYAAAIARVPLPPRERWASRAVLPRWMARNRRRLWIDGRAAGRALLVRAGLARPRVRPGGQAS